MSDTRMDKDKALSEWICKWWYTDALELWSRLWGALHRVIKCWSAFKLCLEKSLSLNLCGFLSGDVVDIWSVTSSPSNQFPKAPSTAHCRGPLNHLCAPVLQQKNLDSSTFSRCVFLYIYGEISLVKFTKNTDRHYSLTLSNVMSFLL